MAEEELTFESDWSLDNWKSYSNVLPDKYCPDCGEDIEDCECEDEEDE